MWFRQDLRVSDNPAFIAAVNNGSIVPIYILDDINAGDHKMGEASRVWLYYALDDLNQSLNGRLKFFVGNAEKIISQLCDNYEINSVYWNRCYEPWRIACDQTIRNNLKSKAIGVHSYNGSLLWEPWEVLKADGMPYKVFTPFYRRRCLSASPPRQPYPAPEKIQFSLVDVECLTLKGLRLLPTVKWDEKFSNVWDMTVKGAVNTLNQFIEGGITNYKKGHDSPAEKSVSRLSAYLHFGQLSPQQIWHETLKKQQDDNVDHFQSELGWREFSYSLLFHFPHLPKQNLQQKFDRFPWQNNPSHITAWQQGNTGYPIVDAGMRELWKTGYMHNRVRMIVGSFLVKNLLVNWRVGEAWFWNCLVDADLANNSASWQWIAGCGADAAPYFRIFNPITQGEKFDTKGVYTRKFVPELKDLPDKYLFKPFAAPEEILQQAGVVLGENYPHPIVDLKYSRERALETFKSL